MWIEGYIHNSFPSTLRPDIFFIRYVKYIFARGVGFWLAYIL